MLESMLLTAISGVGHWSMRNSSRVRDVKDFLAEQFSCILPKCMHACEGFRFPYLRRDIRRLNTRLVAGIPGGFHDSHAAEPNRSF